MACSVAVLAIAGNSCTSEYRIEEGWLDKSITVGGDSLALPIGITDSITVGQFLNLDSVEFLFTDDNGNYYLEISDSFSENVSMEEYAEKLSLEGFSKVFDDTRFTVPGGLVPDIQTGKVSADVGFENEFVYKFSFQDARDSGIIRINTVWFKDSYLAPHVNISADKAIPASLRMRLHVEAPDKYVFDGGTRSDIVFEGPVSQSGDVDFERATLTSMVLNLGEDDEFEFEDTFRVTGMFLEMDASDADAFEGAEIVISSDVSVGGDDGMLHPEAFLGKADITLDRILKDIAMDGIPDYLKGEDICLDFSSPYARISLTSNIGVPFIIDASVEPYYSTGSSSVSPLQLSLDAPVSDDASVFETLSYWLSEEEPSGIAPDYTWVEADMNSIFRRIPDSFSINILPHSDVSGQEDDYVDCNAEYAFEGEMAFTLPLAFGEDLYVPVRDTMPGMPEELKSTLEVSDISIKGNVLSTFPVSLKISAYFLDSEGFPLDISVSSQEIQSLGADGMPVSSPLALTAEKSPQAGDISSMVLELELLPGSVSGIAISENSWIQAEIALQIPGGITLDLE